MSSHIHHKLSVTDQILLVFRCISLFTGIDQALHSALHRNLCFPHRHSHFCKFIFIVQHNNQLFFSQKSSVCEKVFFPQKHLQRPCSKCLISFVDLDQFPVECDHLLIFSSPRICPPVIRIGKTAYSCFIPVIDRRGTYPCHLKCRCLSHHRRFNEFIRCFRSEMFHTPNHMIGSCKKPGVVMIGKLVHRRQKGRHEHICHMV